MMFICFVVSSISIFLALKNAVEKMKFPQDVNVQSLLQNTIHEAIVSTTIPFIAFDIRLDL